MFLVATLRAQFLAQYSLFFPSTMWMVESVISLGNLKTTQRLGNSIFTEEDRQSLQEDSHEILAWFDRWEVPLNVEKSWVHHVGTRNKEFDYERHDAKLKSVQCVKDMGFKIASILKF